MEKIPLLQTGPLEQQLSVQVCGTIDAKYVWLIIGREAKFSGEASMVFLEITNFIESLNCWMPFANEILKGCAEVNNYPD